MFAERGTVFNACDELVHERCVERLVHQHVGALGKFREPRIVFGIAREHDDSIRRCELVGEIVSDGRMRRAKGGDRKIVVFQEDAIGVNVLGDKK